MSDLKSRLASLTPEQRTRLLQKLKEDTDRPGSPAFFKADRSVPLPLSFPQRRLWFLERLDGASAAYNMPAAFRLCGALKIDLLQNALGEIIRRHEILRTRLVAVDGEPWQVIDAPRPLHLNAQPIDRNTLHECLHREAARPFDLAVEHPLRVQLLQLAADEHVVFINIHHIASDGWSTGVLMLELTALYNAYAENQPSPLAELPIQYADFAAWQQLTATQQTAASLDFWRQELANAPTGTNLPTDFPRRVETTTAGDTVQFTIDAETRLRIEVLAQASESSVYQVLLTVFFCLLQRWSGETDIIVGSPIANRTRPELEGLIGFFANTLPIRAHLGGDPDFRSLLHRVRSTTLAAYAHAELPFEQLVEKINPERRLNQSPFFQVMFAMQSGGPVAVEGLRGVHIETLPLSTGASRLDLTLSMQESATGFSACLEYASALFKPETAQRFSEHFRNLLSAALRDPDLPLSRLELLSKAERHRLLIEWNRTDTARDRHLCLHHRVEQQARLTPNATALTWGEQDFSYRWLLDQSARIACLLREKGIAPDQLVGVCLDRSPTMVAALLGVLRAGGAYVALDPAYPPARLHYIIKDSAAPLILTSRHYQQEIFATTTASAVIALDTIDLPPVPENLPASPVGPDNLAYVLYTSGSTGQPKGVAIEHHSPAALIDWARSVWSVDELAGVLAGTSICFDLSIFEIFLPLSVGGSVILAENVLELPNLPARKRVSLVNTVPSAIDALLRQNALPASVRVVNLAGEPLTTELADRVYAVPTVCKVYDLYGPSEDTTYSTYKLRHPGEAASIGRPIANTRLFILDRALQLLPVGVPGEIYLAGEGLARGYLGRPDLTAERFIDCPYLPGERMYRTGDLARFRPDGNVDYLGRLDHQVKLRGFRIELGEIESVLMAFAGVSHCVVIVAEASAGNPRLVGYVAHPSGAAILPALRAHLLSRLPDYMVPAALLVLDALPLTPNRKIDRQALPAPEAHTAARSAGAPLTAEERLLAQLWESLLGVAAIQHDDDFFALGGHSLLAVRLQSRIRHQFQCELALRDLFEHSRLQGMANLIARQVRSAQADAIVPIVPVARGGRLPLSFAQERLWFLNQMDPDSAAYNMPGALRLRGPVNLAALQGAFHCVVDRHEILRLAFPAQAGVAGAVPVGEFPRLSAVDLRQAPAGALQAYLEDDASRPFDLANGPLIRAAALQTGDDEIVLAATLHHIVADGWSIGLFLSELCAHYAALIAGGSAALPPLAIQYADFAAWQRSRYAEGGMASQLAYWKNALADAPALLELPSDRPRPATQRYRGSSLTVAIDASLAAQLDQSNQQQGTTAFMTLLTTYTILLSRYSGQDDIVVGFPSAGRNRSELEPLLGMFVNTLPLRLTLDADPSFSELLAQTRTRTLEALSNQDLPFEKLVDELAVQRNLAYSPIFQAMFVMQNAPAFAALPAGIDLEPYAAGESATAKFDLTLSIAEQNDGLIASFEYDTDLFDSATVARMAKHFLAILRAGLSAPDTPVGELQLLDEQERHCLLDEWNATETAYPRESCVPQLFEEQVARTPEAVALATDEAQLSYRALNQRANQLAHHLRGLGVTTETPVAVCVERSLELVVAILGILKAGGTYVPLDCNDPADRQRFVLEDSAARILVTHSQAATRLPTANSLQRVCLDADRAAIARASSENPRCATTAEHLAYIMYTSGSTGRPKGVCVPHRGIVRLVKNTDYVTVGVDDVLLQMAPITFDASTFELWAALLNGARLAIFPPEPPTVEKLGSVLRRHRVSVLWLTAGLFHLMVDEHPECLGSVKQLLAGGDVLSPQHARKFLRVSPGACLINGYGPTENTTFTCCLRMTAPEQVGHTVAIGRPIANTRVYVLDRHRQPVPIGVPGELYAGGDGCARGYLNDAALTAERFLADPFSRIFSQAPGTRLYRTGDRVRYLADGNIEFLGRYDQQIKIRGFRIEPGEIEAHLCRHPAVRAAAVVVQRSDKPPKLVAFVVPECHETTTDALLTALTLHVGETLPAYLRPALFLPIDALPLTGNDKLDRQALMAKIPAAPPPDEAFAADGTEEETLVEVWREILHLPQVGIHDNYFALGGDSILTIVMIARLRERGWQLKPKDVFRHQTIRELATVLKRLEEQAAPVEETGRLALTPLQRMFFALQPPSPNHFNQAVLLRLATDISAEHLGRALAEIVRSHPALRSRFVFDGTQWHQDIVDDRPADGLWPLAVHDLADEAPGRRCGALETLCNAAERSLDIGTGPVFGAALFRLGDGEANRLLLLAHHLVVDAVSWRIIAKDLETALRQLRAADLPTQSPTLLPTRFPSLSPEACSPAAYRRALQAYDYSSEQAYWRQIAVTGGDALLAFDAGRKGQPSPANIVRRLPTAETRSLLTEVHRAYNTQVPDLLLTALGRELCRLTGREAVLVDIEGHGRDALGEAIDLNRSVGWFTTLYPVRLSCPPAQPIALALPLVKESLRGADNGGIGYSLMPPASANADVCFNYLGHSGGAAVGEAILGIAPESPGEQSAADLPRRYRLDCNASVVDGELILSYGFDTRQLDEVFVEALSSRVLDNLKALIAACIQSAGRNYTPSDFAEVSLVQDELDELLGDLDLSGLETS